MSSWRQWKIGSDVSNSAKMHPMAHMSEQVVVVVVGVVGLWMGEVY